MVRLGDSHWARTSDTDRLNLKMSYRCGLDQVICLIKLSLEWPCIIFFISLRTLRTTFTELRSSFASSASRYLAVSAIHANASSVSGPEVGNSTIIGVVK